MCTPRKSWYSTEIERERERERERENSFWFRLYVSFGCEPFGVPVSLGWKEKEPIVVCILFLASRPSTLHPSDPPPWTKLALKGLYNDGTAKTEH
jgi:hypothetical protein